MYISRKTLLIASATVLASLIVSVIECYPHKVEKRATGGVPQMDDRLIINQRAQNLDTTAIANASLLTSNGLSRVVSLLESLVANSETLLQVQSEQFKHLENVVSNSSNSLENVMTFSSNSLERQFDQLSGKVEDVVTSMAILQKGMRLTAGNCSDIANHGPYSSGVYKITPWDDLGYDGAFKVYCDMADDDAWTVIERRMDGSVDFFLGWEDYKNGFGNLDGEFWLGLDKLYRLTKTKLTWQLKVELKDFDGNTAYADYDNFSIGDESTNFQLTIGAYSGTAGDSLTYHNNMSFSTKDRDNDLNGGDCADVRGGAWWYNQCEYSNLNGNYMTSATNSAKSIHWYHWKNSRVALKKTLMKIKPIEITALIPVLAKGIQLTAGDCSDVAAQGPYSSGVYEITPWDDMGIRGSFKAFCDMADDGGWTVIQRRMDGSVDFFLGWEDYKNGFGNLYGEFWLGFDKLYRLATNTKLRWQLRVELEDFDGSTVYADYDSFSVGDESTNFQLTVGGYSGTAGDALTHHQKEFSTKDRDNSNTNNCAVSRKSAWWFGPCDEYCNLNGPYLTSATSTKSAITWWSWKSSYVSLKKSQMKIKPYL